MDDLYERILPLLQPNYESLMSIPGAQEALSDDYFLHSKQELIEAIVEYDDAYGPVGALYKYGKFRKCSCVDARGRRRVCIPPEPGKMCRRKPVVWLRMTLTTPEQYRFQQLKRNEIKTLVSGLNDCKHKAKLFLESRIGKKMMRKRAKVLARESRVIKRNKKRNINNKKKLKRKELKSEGKVEARKKKLEKKEVQYRIKLKKETKQLKEDQDIVFGQAKEELEDRLMTIEMLLNKDNCLENSDGKRELFIFLFQIKFQTLEMENNGSVIYNLLIFLYSSKAKN